MVTVQALELRNYEAEIPHLQQRIGVLEDLARSRRRRITCISCCLCPLTNTIMLNIEVVCCIMFIVAHTCRYIGECFCDHEPIEKSLCEDLRDINFTCCQISEIDNTCDLYSLIFLPAIGAFFQVESLDTALLPPERMEMHEARAKLDEPRVRVSLALDDLLPIDPQEIVLEYMEPVRLQRSLGFRSNWPCSYYYNHFSRVPYVNCNSWCCSCVSVCYDDPCWIHRCLCR